jgi:hypothetical protein
MDLLPVEVANAIERTTGYYQRIIQERTLCVTTNYAARAALARAGFSLSICPVSPEDATLRVEQHQLRPVFDVLGRLKLAGYDVIDTRKRLVDVKLMPQAFPGVVVKYQRTLPRGSRCRIVQVKRGGYKSYKSPEVVCGTKA